MPRYEFQEGTSSKFWQIDLDGTSFKVTYGKIGTPGRFGIKKWPDAATCKKEYDKLVAEKTKKGYTLIGGGGGKAAKAPAANTEAPAAKSAASKANGAAAGKAAKAPAKVDGKKAAALEKSIDADPDNSDAWSVYADWLQSQGDPRGELAAVQARLESEPKNAGLLSAEKKLLKEHSDLLVGKLAKYMYRAGSKAIPGVTTKAPLGPDARSDNAKMSPINPLWRAGFITSAFIGYPGYDWSEGGGGDDDDDGGGGDDGGEVDVPKLLGDFLSHPTARFLTSLRIGMAQNMEDGENDYTPVMKKLATLDATSRLRSLYIGDVTQDECEVSWLELGDVSKLLAKTPKLRSLTLRGGSDLKLGTIALPELRELTIITGGLDKKNVASICNAKWSKLEKLELWFGSNSYGANTSLKDIKAILDAKGFPAVKHLGLRNCEFVDEICEALAGSKILKQLEVLDLSKGMMTAAGVKALAANKAAFSKLTRLDLSDNFLEAAEMKIANGIMNQVRTKPQRKGYESDGEVRRYVSLGE